MREILRGDKVEKAWVITRILEHAKWEDIGRYLTVRDIQENFECLRFRWPRDRELWACAIARWTGNGHLADDLLDQLDPTASHK